MGVNFWKDNEHEERKPNKTKPNQSNSIRFTMDADDRVDFEAPPHNFYRHNQEFGSIRFTSK